MVAQLLRSDFAGNGMPDELSELLHFMRGRLGREAWVPDGRLARLMARTHPEFADLEPQDQATFAATEIRLSVESLEADQRTVEAIRIMIGDDSSAIASTSPLRTEATLRMAIALSGPGEAPVSRRRVEQLERGSFGPAILRAVGAPRKRAKRPIQAPWRQCKVHVRLGPICEDGQALEYRYRIEFEAIDESVMIAVTEDDGVADHICSLAGELTDVVVPGLGLAGSRAFSVHQILVGGSRKRLPMTGCAGPQEVAEISGVQYFTTGPLARGAKRLELACMTRISIREQLTYWTAPRRMELLELVFDYSAFPDRAQRVFTLYPRTGRAVRASQDDDEAVFVVDVRDWLQPGQGFELHWGGK